MRAEDAGDEGENGKRSEGGDGGEIGREVGRGRLGESLGVPTTLDGPSIVVRSASHTNGTRWYST
jgi:hypothetical protein